MKRIVLSSLFLFFVAHVSAQNKIAGNPKELRAAVKSAKPGETIFLAKGEWKDANLIIEGNGSRQKPITISAEKPGMVVLSGNSSLKIAGTYLTVKDLHFKDGYTKQGDVIIFKTDDDKLANNCRLTGIVMENFSKPERFSSDNWVVLWGKNNRVDHCTFVNKLNHGPTLIVELNDERSQQNYHSVDSNYFKGRDRFGANGGETIRIGVSKYSLTPSRTNIKYNFFERCNGEVEIVSVKSGENQVSFNTFYECEGSVVLRHGNRNRIEGNLFLGNNKPHTGGIRVINPGHEIFNNVLKDLKGDRFRTALAVMNGVPNSLINRYHQVKDVDIHHNTFFNCNSIDFGTGNDAERTAIPENVKFRNNLIVNPLDTLYKDYNSPSGIIFSSNGVANWVHNTFPAGFKKVSAKIKTFKGIEMPQPAGDTGASPGSLPLVKREDTGAKWYRSARKVSDVKAKRYEVSIIKSSMLAEVLRSAAAGDTIVLSDAGNYALDKELLINKPLVLMAAPGLPQKPVLVNASQKSFPSFITIENGGSLKIKGIGFLGAYQNYEDIATGIRSTVKPMNQHYSLYVDGCEFSNFNEGSHSAIRGSKGTYADSIVVRNSVFRNMSGTAIDLATEKDDKGNYNAEYVVLENNLFTGILGSALNLYRGGNDESTLGPLVNIDHCTFNEVDNKAQGSVLRLLGVQSASIKNCIFSLSGQGGRVIQFQEYIWDDLKVDYCNLFKSGRIDSFYGKVSGKNIYNLKPQFIEPAKLNFNLQANSPLIDKSSTSGPLGARL